MPEGLVLQSPVPEVELTIPRGMTYTFWVWGGKDSNGNVISYSGYTGRGEIRDTDGATTVLLGTFTVTVTGPTQSDAISVAEGITDEWLFTITLPATQSDYSVTAIDTAVNDTTKGPVYDIEAVNGSTIVKIARGPVKYLYDRTHL